MTKGERACRAEGALERHAATCVAAGSRQRRVHRANHLAHICHDAGRGHHHFFELLLKSLHLISHEGFLPVRLKESRLGIEVEWLRNEIKESDWRGE